MEFQGFPKMSRLSRDVIVTEKIDGTNAQIFISEPDDNGNMIMMAGSRTRWITPDNDNAGFARWCRDNAQELMRLGPGRHFGEWWGQGIQRGYGLKEKRFSLFNVARWTDEVRPQCCHVVPILWQGIFDTNHIDACLELLLKTGSLAADGFMQPEGICIFHTAGNISFKKTLVKDDMPKSISGV